MYNLLARYRRVLNKLVRSEQTDPLKAHFTGSYLLDGSSDRPLRIIHIQLFDT